MFCPLKFNSKTLRDDGGLDEGDCECERELCRLWEFNTGTCGLATQAYLAGIAVVRKEMGDEWKVDPHGGRV
jgi:hypothetical protein